MKYSHKRHTWPAGSVLPTSHSGIGSRFSLFIPYRLLFGTPTLHLPGTQPSASFSALIPPTHTRLFRHHMMLLDKNEIIKDTHFAFAFLIQQYLAPGPSKHGVCVWSLPLMAAQRLQRARPTTYARAPTPTGTCTTDRFYHQEQHLRKGPRTGSCVVSLLQGTSPGVALLDGGCYLRCHRCATFQTGCDL